MIKDFGRNLSIRARIFMGFAGAMSGFIIASVISIYSLYKLDSNFEEIEKDNRYIQKIVTIDTEVTQLQRSVTVYMYTGHNSVRRAIDKKHKTLSAHIEELLTDSSNVFDQEYGDRLKNHLDTYVKTFKDADVEYALKRKLIRVEMPRILTSLKSVGAGRALASIEVAIHSYLDDPGQRAADRVLAQISDFKRSLLSSRDRESAQNLRKVFVRATQAVRSSLYLVNVVMAGEAAEFGHTSRELKDRTVASLVSYKKSLNDQNKSIRFLLTIFFVVFPILMVFYSWYVSSSISSPLARITETFKNIRAGDLEVAIPEQDRTDEIGSLSKAAEIFRERTKRLEDSNDELSQFAYRTSHDLKAPLVSIIGLVGIIGDDLEAGDVKEAQKSLSKIEASAQKLEALIGDILSLSKSDSVENPLEPCDLGEIVASITVKIDHLLHQFGVSVVPQGLEGKSIFCQRVRLEQVLENLISNAIKYSDPSKEDRYVKIQFQAENNRSRLTVSDNGLGIPEKFQGNLFQMFKRFHTNVAFGSGLGLYLVKKHLQKMDGSMTCESKEGQGTVFQVSLPK